MSSKKVQILSGEEQGKLPVLVFHTAVAGLFVWNLAVFFAPIMAASNHAFLQILGGGVYFFMDPVCHQLPERSLFIDGWPLPVCGRCTTIYLSAFATLLFYMLKGHLVRWPGWIYLGIILFVGLEIGLEKLDLIQNWFELRLLNGSLLGILFARLFMESIFNFHGNEQNE